MKTLDKKQIPQFAALCVLSAGLFGYLVVKMVSPNTAAAGTRPAGPAAPAVKPDAGTVKPGPNPAGPSAAASTPGGEATADSTDAPPPSPGMRDPFAIGYVDPKAAAPAPAAAPGVPKLPAPGTQIASIKEVGPGIGPAPISFPGAPALPSSLSGFPLRPGTTAPSLPAGPPVPPLPSAPPPAWTVTGVLQGATEKIAVLRSGEARRIVRSGDFVDSTFRVVAVSRTSVVLRHGAASYRLPLGGPKDAAGKSSAAPAAAVPAVAAPLPVAAPAGSPASSGSPAASPSPAPGIPVSLPASFPGLAGQLEQALPSALTTDSHHG